MKGRTLKRLAGVADIAKLDVTENAAVLAPHERGVSANYYGSYQACEIIGEDAVLDRSIAVSPSQLKSIAELFDDGADVELTHGSDALIVRARGRSASIRYDPRAPISTAPLVAERPLGSANRTALLAEVTLAASVASKLMTSPILTGVRLAGSAQAQKIAFQAADGVGLVYQSTIEAALTDSFDMIIPTNDLLASLKIMDGETLTVGELRNQILIQSDTAAVRIPTLQGKWPNFSALSKYIFVDHLELSSVSIRALAQAVRVYKAGDTATLRPAEGGVILETPNGELGQFQEAIGGSVSAKYALGADALDTASRVSDDTVSLDFADGMAVAHHERRKLYIALRYK